MKTRQDVTAEKLRGGFYTPPALVRVCLDRLVSLVPEGDLRILEPAAGDGAFLRGIARDTRLAERTATVRAVELLQDEATKASLSIRAGGLPGSVVTGSAIDWAAETDEWFDAVVGNPPFVRYQFIDGSEQLALRRLSARLDAPFAGVGNLWIPVLLGALSRLRSRGAFASVVPTECFTGCSAALVRGWLLREVDDLRFDLFPAGSFPTVLQEVSVISGRRAAESRRRPGRLSLVDHERTGRASRWQHQPSQQDKTWTRYLLSPAHMEAAAAVDELPAVRTLGDVARLEVSTVTGANDFFCVDQATLIEHGLTAWAHPLLPRARAALGIAYTNADQQSVRASGAKCWLLDFRAASPDPMRFDGPRRYLEWGVERGLHRRYKCRIREPWYRVPSIRTETLMLSKRSHIHPRLLLNEARAHTTDTIYRGRVLDSAGLADEDLVAGFHSSVTLLSVELEGRSFGGGVLELVPSEIARLHVPVVHAFGEHLPPLDRVARSGDAEALVAETDRLLIARGVVPRDLLEVLADARAALAARRLDRNRRPAPAYDVAA